ncbi:MAG: rod shape-determining protein [Deltaproteobacteria bacterium]|nr:rod shape-determining protein [Deltaproteobacteria bacterium]
MAHFLPSWFSSDIAIDLGTSNTLLFLRGRGIVINEPSVVAVDKRMVNKNRVVAVGREAKDMLGRTPGTITAIRPIQKGVISDFDATVEMLRTLLERAIGRMAFLKPRVVVGVPVGITEVEKRAVKESAESANAGEVFLIEEPMAAAIGAGMPITEPYGNMIVDVGGGTTEVAVISLGGIVYSHSVRIGGDNLDGAITAHIKKHYSLLIGERTAEQIKIRLGTAFPDDDLGTMEVKGRDIIAGVPRTIEVGSAEVREAMAEPIATIAEAVRTSLERTPPELASDIVDRGIILSGGGSLLRNLDVLLHSETGVPVMLSSDPLCGTVLGAGKVLEEIDQLRQVLTV